MIALDTNVLVRYLINDDARQAAAARALLSELTVERPGFVCREVVVELVWVLQRTYGFSRGRIAGVLEDLLASRELLFETGNDVARAVFAFRKGGAELSDLMIAAATRRGGAYPLYTFDRQAAQLDGVVLLTEDAP